ncbi:MAG: spore germination protein [Clostridia bacterium]|nr:spore germination protein [Clostridia bacterium]MDN5322081.1 spore germination protein [Clostridia bacterium]
MRKVVIPILLVALLITGYFAYNQYRINQDLIRRAESQYQRSFHELVWNVDTINSQLAQTLVSSSPEQIMLSLTNLWRETFSASSNLGGIPITMVELDKTDQLLNDIADYSYYILKKNKLQKEDLTEKEWNKLQELYKRSKIVKNELQNIEAAVLDRDLSFVEVETVVLRKGQDLADNTITDGFRTIEDKVKAFPDLQFDEGVQKIEPEPQPIGGKEISENEAIEIARKFMNDHDGPITKAEMSFSSNGKIPTYGVRTFKKGEEIPTYVEVTKKGGQVIQMYMQRPIKEANIDFKAAEEEARKFLEEHGFNNMDLVEIDTDTNTAILTFVPTQQGVRLYSDMVRTHVALDNGQVISFDQTSYLSYHRERTLSTPKLQEQQVTDDMNPNFKVEQVNLALVPSEYETTEILCYEVRGKMDSERFILFVNADTGEDVRIVRMTKPKEFEISIR